MRIFGKRQRQSGLLSVLVCLSAVAAFPGCDGQDPLLRDRFTFEGLQREYLLHVPRPHDPGQPSPLVLMLHGKDQNPEDIRYITGWDAVSNDDHLFVAYPNAYRGAWNDGRVVPTQPSYAQDVDDVAFLQEVVARIAANYNIDLSRVYACGFSNGGAMVYRLGLESAGLFAALGVVSGAVAVDLAGLTPDARTALIAMHGTRDRVVPYGGGELFPDSREPQGAVLPVEDSVGMWVAFNDCPDADPPARLPDGGGCDRTTVRRFVFAPCADETEVWFYKIEDGGHVWHGAPWIQRLFMPGRHSGGVEATPVIWSFFQRHSRTPPAG